jgi:hypothetical protein
MDMLSEEWAKENKDKKNGHTYRSNMAGPAEESGETEQTMSTPPIVDTTNVDNATKKKIVFCQTCKKYGHMRRTSKYCMAGPSEVSRETDQTMTTPPIVDTTNVNNATKKKIVFCNACKKYGHMRRTSMDCSKNPKSKYYLTGDIGT